ncbi:MAG: indole-3-glycerol-phosphate synthase TrpC, partial [Psychrobacter sp.]|nr:indole-3-glycerol-phosphate synthase TrpC [Psychrobacter sp.]
MTTTHTQIPTVLQRIVATKVEEVKAAREALSLEDLKAKVAAETKPRRGFAAALRAADIGIIAEIKKASPS